LFEHQTTQISEHFRLYRQKRRHLGATKDVAMG